MLANFYHCGYFTHTIWQFFRVMPPSSDMFCRLDAVFRWCLSHLSGRYIRLDWYTFHTWLCIHVEGVMKCDACTVDHVVRNPRPFPSNSAYCKWPKNGREGLETRLVGVSLGKPHINVLSANGVCMYVCVYVCLRMNEWYFYATVQNQRATLTHEAQ